MGSKNQGKQQRPQETSSSSTTTTVIIKDEADPNSYANMSLNSFWPSVMHRIKNIKTVDAKNQQLPLARIKKIMKLDEDVTMISAEAPLLFAKAAEIFIHELTLMAWVFTEENKRRTLQRSDIAMAISKYDQFDFLIDIVPREEIRPATTKKEGTASESEASADGMSKTNAGDDAVEVSLATATTPAESNKPDSSAQIQYYLQLAQQQRQAMAVQIAGSSAESSQAAGPTVGRLMQTVGANGTTMMVPTTTNGLSAGNLITTPGGAQTSIPITTLLTSHPSTATATGVANNQHHHQPQQQHILNPIQFQQPTQQIITLSNGQQILVSGQQQQQPQTILGGGQVIGNIAGGAATTATHQPQFHILQQIMSPTGEMQHIQIPVATNNLNLFRMGGAGGNQVQVQQPQQHILIQSPHQQGQLMAANGGAVFLNTMATSATGGGSSDTSRTLLTTTTQHQQQQQPGNSTNSSPMGQVKVEKNHP